MATDLAEVIGGAVALYLLFDIPLLLGGIITGAVSMILLAVQSRRGPRPFEFVIIALMVIITVGFIAGLFVAPPDASSIVGGLVPRFEDTGSVLLAASILGATIMPHAIYAHSSLTRDRFGSTTTDAPTEAVRTETSRIRRLLTATRWDVSIAMVIAGTVNLGILLLAAANLAGVEGTDSLEGAHAALAAGLGPVVATFFAVGLLLSLIHI